MDTKTINILIDRVCDAVEDGKLSRLVQRCDELCTFVRASFIVENLNSNLDNLLKDEQEKIETEE